LKTDLALARAEITKLRAERHQHQQQLRRALGAQLDSIARTDLAARVDELTRANAELTATTAHQHTVNQTLQAQITTLEDELAAARTSLRRMIRAENRPADE
jgi:outer membrane protein TolC